VVEMYRGTDAAAQPTTYLVHPTTAPVDALLGADPPWAPAMDVAWGPDIYRTHFRAVWRPDGLGVRFDVDDVRPWHTMVHRDACLWEEEVVEVFLDPTCTGCDYAELEISPANVVCDLHIERLAPERRVHMDWHFASLATHVRPGARRDGWIAVAWLPFADFASLSPEVAARMPAVAGDIWHFNVFRIKRPHGPDAPERDAIYAAWSVPDGATFHAPASFRPLRFA
jgi:hypothetical protein